MQLTQVLDKLIELAKERDRFRGRSTRPRKRTGKLIAVPLSELKPVPPPPQNEAIRALLADQSPAAIIMVEVVMYLGRGDFDADDLLGHYSQLSDTFRRPEWTIQHMIGKNPLADYLETGRAKLRAARVDLDRVFGG